MSVEQKLQLPRSFSLTGFLHLRVVKEVWKARLPYTQTIIGKINQTYIQEMLIAPSPWVREKRQWGCIGTAYDYLVGALWAKASLDGVFDRARSATRRYQQLHSLIDLLENFLMGELSAVSTGNPEKRQPDFFRGLGLLAHFDAMSRAPVSPPPWTSTVRVRSKKELTRVLQEHYPDEFANELQLLFQVTQEDLPRAKRVVYNPTFGCLVGSAPLPADGDLIIGDLLLELKVSVEGFRPEHIWQLLGYAALNANQGRHRIRRIGIYNPRYRALWVDSTESLIRTLGGCSWKQFHVWFNTTMEQYIADALRGSF